MTRRELAAVRATLEGRDGDGGDLVSELWKSAADLLESQGYLAGLALKDRLRGRPDAWEAELSRLAPSITEAEIKVELLEREVLEHGASALLASVVSSGAVDLRWAERSSHLGPLSLSAPSTEEGQLIGFEYALSASERERFDPVATAPLAFTFTDLLVESEEDQPMTLGTLLDDAKQTLGHRQALSRDLKDLVTLAQTRSRVVSIVLRQYELAGRVVALGELKVGEATVEQDAASDDKAVRALFYMVRAEAEEKPQTRNKLHEAAAHLSGYWKVHNVRDAYTLYYKRLLEQPGQESPRGRRGVELVLAFAERVGQFPEVRETWDRLSRDLRSE